MLKDIRPTPWKKTRPNSASLTNPFLFIGSVCQAIPAEGRGEPTEEV